MFHQCVQRAGHEPKHFSIINIPFLLWWGFFHFISLILFGSTPFLFAPYLFQAHSFDVGGLPSVKPLFHACSTLKSTAATWLQVDPKLKEKIRTSYLYFHRYCYIHTKSISYPANMYNKRPPLFHLSFSRKPKSCVVCCLFFSKVLIATSRSKEGLKSDDKKLPSAILNRNS